MAKRMYYGFANTLNRTFTSRLADLEGIYNFELGNELETAIVELLHDFLPDRFGVCRGHIVAKSGASAGDDIIVFDRLLYPTLRSKQMPKQFVPTEAVLAYIEVKHSLELGTPDGQSLHRAIQQVTAVRRVFSYGVRRFRDLLPPDAEYSSLELPHTNRMFGMVLARNAKLNGKRLEDTADILKELNARFPTIQYPGPDLVVVGDQVVGTPVRRIFAGNADGLQNLHVTQGGISSIFQYDGPSLLEFADAKHLGFGLGMLVLMSALGKACPAPIPWEDVIEDVVTPGNCLAPRITKLGKQQRAELLEERLQSNFTAKPGDVVTVGLIRRDDSIHDVVHNQDAKGVRSTGCSPESDAVPGVGFFNVVSAKELATELKGDPTVFVLWSRQFEFSDIGSANYIGPKYLNKSWSTKLIDWLGSSRTHAPRLVKLATELSTDTRGGIVTNALLLELGFAGVVRRTFKSELESAGLVRPTSSTLNQYFSGSPWLPRAPKTLNLNQGATAQCKDNFILGSDFHFADVVFECHDGSFAACLETTMENDILRVGIRISVTPENTCFELFEDAKGLKRVLSAEHKVTDARPGEELRAVLFVSAQDLVAVVHTQFGELSFANGTSVVGRISHGQSSRACFVAKTGPATLCSYRTGSFKAIDDRRGFGSVSFGSGISQE